MRLDVPDREQMAKRQQVLADFGEFALRSDDLDAVLTEACRLVGDALGTGRSKILEIDQTGRSLLVRAGVGWDQGIAGRLRIPMDERSSETFAIRAGEPVISQDASKDERFELPPFMRQAGVRSLANVPISLPGGRPYGLLQVDAIEPRAFDEEDTRFLRTYAMILGPVIDRLFRLQDLRASEERFRVIVAAARDYAIFITDAEDRIIDWLPGAAAIFGWSEEEIVGRPAAILFTPEDLDRQKDKEEVAIAIVEGTAPNVRWHLCKDGSRVFIEGSVTALRNEGGVLQGFLKIGQDVTRKRRRDERLRQSEERFRQFGEASSDLIWIRDAESLQFEYVSPAFEMIYGRSRAEVLKGNTFERWVELIHHEDRDRTVANIKRVRAGERVTHEFRIVRSSDEEIRWIENTDFPLFGADGEVQRIAGIAKDVTEDKASAARLEVLVAELQHRSRNLLGVISSVASKTLGSGRAVDDFRTRLKALSRAQGLLSQFGSDTVELGALIREELAAHTDATPPKVGIAGPKVHLTARQVQNFALALHELTTNAVKYGALRDGAGRLEVAWAIDRDQSGRRCLKLDWIESGVPIDQEKAQRRGYGRELIENALSYALQAKTLYALESDGVRCRITMPLE